MDMKKRKKRLTAQSLINDKKLGYKMLIPATLLVLMAAGSALADPPACRTNRARTGPRAYPFAHGLCGVTKSLLSELSSSNSSATVPAQAQEVRATNIIITARRCAFFILSSPPSYMFRITHHASRFTHYVQNVSNSIFTLTRQYTSSTAPSMSASRALAPADSSALTARPPEAMLLIVS